MFSPTASSSLSPSPDPAVNNSLPYNAYIQEMQHRAVTYYS